jgi:uncharacterized protein (TIGR02246 family)
MRRLALAVLSLTFPAFLACRPATTELTEEQKAAIADTVRQLSMDYLASVSTLDADTVMGFHIDSDEFAWSIDSELSLDFEAVKASAAAKYAALVAARVSLDTVRVAVLGPDAAVLSGAGAAYVTDPAGQEMKLPLAVTFVAARRGGRWVLLQGHSSHAPPESV